MIFYFEMDKLGDFVAGIANGNYETDFDPGIGYEANHMVKIFWNGHWQRQISIEEFWQHRKLGNIRDVVQ